MNPAIIMTSVLTQILIINIAGLIIVFYNPDISTSIIIAAMMISTVIIQLGMKNK